MSRVLFFSLICFHSFRSSFYAPGTKLNGTVIYGIKGLPTQTFWVGSPRFHRPGFGVNIAAIV